MHEIIPPNTDQQPNIYIYNKADFKTSKIFPLRWREFSWISTSMTLWMNNKFKMFANLM